MGSFEELWKLVAWYLLVTPPGIYVLYGLSTGPIGASRSLRPFYLSWR